MIIPVVFSLSPTFNNLMYTWVFYKGIDLAKRYGWPVFAQRQYFEETEQQRKMGLLSDAVAKANDYEPYCQEDAESYIHVIFPEKEIQRYIKSFPSQTDAYLASQLHQWPEITAFMVEQVRRIEKELGEKAEAFYCLHDTPFIREAAKQLGIDVIHMEWGPFRKPCYRDSAYFDLKGSVCDGEMAERYLHFEKVADQLHILSKREILALFLLPEYLNQAEYIDQQPEYEAGLALGYNLPHNFTAANQVTAVELLTKVGQRFSCEDICVRYHPGDPVRARLSGIHEESDSLFEFIQSCRRIYCISSNVSYEAMLYNKPVYELGNSQYGLFANRGTEEMLDHIPDDRFMSFIAFGYLVPFELLKDIAYIRWRLSRPREEEIYRFHLCYYLDRLHLDEDVLLMPQEVRLKEILLRRKAPLNKIKYEKSSKQCHRAIVYRDEGNGFSEAQTWRVPVGQEGSLKFEMQLSAGVSAVRIDPVEQMACFIRRMDLTCKEEPCTIKMMNAYETYGGKLLLSNDPQILIYLPERHEVLNMKVELDIVPITYDAAQTMVAALEEMQGKNAELNEVIHQIMDEMQRKNAELNERIRQIAEEREQLFEAYWSISESSFWKITKPFRILLDKIKELRYKVK